MKNNLIRIIALMMAALTLLSALSACASGEKPAATESIGETGTETPEPVCEVDTATLLASNVYAADGLEYALYTCKTYYLKNPHTLKRTLKGGVAEIWYLSAFIEMLAEAHRLYPDNKEIKDYYVDVLDKCLPGYLVKNKTIRTPAKTNFKNITYYNAVKGGTGDFYYDDNAWICYQLLEAYDLLGDQKYLEAAETNLAFLKTGWREDGGGIYWSKDFKSVGTCSTSPTCTCFLRAYMVTNKQEYLDFAIQIYDWARKNVLGSNGMYHGGVGDPWQPSYDSGTMLINSSLLYKITGEKKYQTQAKATALASVSHCFNVTGSAKNKKVRLATNPYYCPWAFTWMLRGIKEYYEIAAKKDETFYDYIKILLDERRGKKNDNGQYDPYLGTGCKDWLGDGSTFGVDDVVIMPSGYAEMLLVVASFDVFTSESALAALETDTRT